MAGEIIRTGICIVGAGPAGAAASLELSKSCIPHLLVDASVFPRHKACGDILTSGAIRALNRLHPGILGTLKDRNQLRPVWKTLVFPPNNEPISLDFLPLDGRDGEPGCLAVSRYDLDLALIEKVKESSFADFREGFRIKSAENTGTGMRLETEDGRVVEAELVIFASGSGGSLLTSLGHPLPSEETALGIRAHYEGVQWNPEETALFLQADSMPGGLYLTPLPDGSCNVNLVLSARKLKKDKVVLRDQMEELLGSNLRLKQAFSHARRKGNPEGSVLSLGLRKRKISGNRYLLAGDAAGLTEFFSGNGIPQAFASGQLAAQYAGRALSAKDFSADVFKAYDREIFRKISPQNTGARLAFPLLHQAFFSRLMLRFLNHLSSRPQTSPMLRSLLYAKRPWHILRNPFFFYRLLWQK